MPHPDSAAAAITSRSWRAALGVALFQMLPAMAWAQLPQRETEPDLSVVLEAEALRPEPTSHGTDRTISFTETMPTFQGGGITKLRTNIQRQVRWPIEVRDLPNGRLFATLTVDPTGQVRNARIICGLHPLIDAEALRVVCGLPGFAPANQNGKPVSVEMTVPIEFKIR